MSDAQLRALAPAPGLHTADLFVIANVAVPEDLTPLDRAAGSVAERIIHLVLALPSEQRGHIHRLVEQLPQEPRTQEGPLKKPLRRVYDLETAGFGAMLVTMLCSNRNLHSTMAAAKTVAMMTSGDMYLSAATYPSIGSGRAELHPRWVASLAMVLGIAAGDLAAITGTELDESLVREDPVSTETAELLWKLRRVSAAQAIHVHEQASPCSFPSPKAPRLTSGTASSTPGTSGGAHPGNGESPGNRRAGGVRGDPRGAALVAASA